MQTQDKVLILHGWGGSDAPHWQAELAAEIAKNYGTVSFPLLDNCHFPSKNRWIKQVKADTRRVQTGHCSLSLFSQYTLVLALSRRDTYCKKTFHGFPSQSHDRRKYYQNFFSL